MLILMGRWVCITCSHKNPEFQNLTNALLVGMGTSVFNHVSGFVHALIITLVLSICSGRRALRLGPPNPSCFVLDDIPSAHNVEPVAGDICRFVGGEEQTGVGYVLDRGLSAHGQTF